MANDVLPLAEAKRAECDAVLRTSFQPRGGVGDTHLGVKDSALAVATTIRSYRPPRFQLGQPPVALSLVDRAGVERLVDALAFRGVDETSRRAGRLLSSAELPAEPDQRPLRALEPLVVF